MRIARSRRASRSARVSLLHLARFSAARSFLELRSRSESPVLHADRVRFGAWRAEMTNRVSRTMHGNADFSERGALAKLIVAVFYLHRFARCLGNDFRRSLTTA